MKKLYMILVIVCCLLCACSKKVDAEKYESKATSLLEANQVEDFTYRSAEVIDAEVEDFIYNYSSNVRDLSFYVETYINDSGERIYYTNYYDAIKQQYLSNINEYVISSALQYDENSCELTLDFTPEEVAVLQKVIEHCNLVYVMENQYHDDQRFTEKYPLLTIHLKTTDGKLIMDETVDGFRDAETFLDDLYEMYQYRIVEGNE